MEVWMSTVLPIILIVGGCILIIISIIGLIAVSRKEKPKAGYPAGGVYIHEIGQNPYGPANFPPQVANPTEPVKTAGATSPGIQGDTAPTQAQQGSQCPICGSAMPADAAFCPYCGYRKS